MNNKELIQSGYQLKLQLMMITMNLSRVFFILMCCYALFSTFRGSFRANYIEQFTTFEREFQFQFKFLGLHLSQETQITLLHLGYIFRSIPNFSGRSYFNSTCLQSHFRRVYLCILFALKYVSCSLAIIRSSLFGLHLGRKTFQNSFTPGLRFPKCQTGI